MKSALLTKDDLSSGVELPRDVEKVLSFMASFGHDVELALWFDDTSIYVYQVDYGLWTMHEAFLFMSGLIATNVVEDYCPALFTAETIRRPSCDYDENVVALTFRRYYCK